MISIHHQILFEGSTQMKMNQACGIHTKNGNTFRVSTGFWLENLNDHLKDLNIRKNNTEFQLNKMGGFGMNSLIPGPSGSIKCAKLLH